ncbi:hypothetical protein PGQ11_007715 [Apiospora arundinis]|uniref:Zn(2)-C6 fungal-type domain-containing protein n=1 Tax=Apiospora arundinis TaxID=335852 RepID=A0ABR2IWF9_9PEZI
MERRTKKTRCDGVRPVCGPCFKRSVGCTYVDPKVVHEENAKVLELLQSVPEQRAINILRLFRTTGDSAKVLSIVKGSVDDEWHQSLQNATYTIPTTNLTTLELELMIKNSVAYPRLRRVSVSELEERNLFRPFTLARTQVAEETEMPFLANNASKSPSPKDVVGTIRVDADSAATCIGAQAPVQQLAERRQELCDRRLNSLDIGLWTKVPIPSDYAAKIISLYLEIDIKQLIIQFRSKYETSICTMLWHTALMYVANAVLQDTDDSQWLEYLLCIYGYETLRRPFRVAETIGRGLLTMALRNKNIKSEDARNILGCLQEQGLGQANKNIRATFMGDLQLAHSNPEAATMERLASNFDDMVLFQDFIHSDSEDVVQ